MVLNCLLFLVSLIRCLIWYTSLLIMMLIYSQYLECRCVPQQTLKYNIRDNKTHTLTTKISINYQQNYKLLLVYLICKRIIIILISCMQTLKPKLFVKLNEKTEKYECTICNYITQKPYLCRGKCEKTFCFQCINCIKRNTNQCPFRCSKPFDLQECKEVELQFNCPFAKNECQNSINSLSQFYQHADVCKFTPQNWKFKEQNYKKYRCDKGHNLFFLDQQDLRNLYGWKFYQCPTNSICSACQAKGLCRSICPQCSVKGKHILYCVDCRKPPCTKKTCLYQHEMRKQINHSKELICDFCGTAAYLLGPYAFRDVRCNFDICEVCYINLPQTHELVPFKMPKSAINHLSNRHSSSYVQNSLIQLLRRQQQMGNHIPQQIVNHIPQPLNAVQNPLMQDSDDSSQEQQAGNFAEQQQYHHQFQADLSQDEYPQNYHLQSQSQEEYNISEQEDQIAEIQQPHHYEQPQDHQDMY